MRTARTIKIAALNIAMHAPHSPQLYMDLFRDAKRMKSLVELGSLHAAILGSLTGPKDYVKDVVLTGEVFRFVRLDANQPWFNTQTSDTASNDDLSEVNIPPHLLPHLQRIEFVFKPSIHQLWFVSQDRQVRMGAKAMETFFQLIFDKVFQAKKASEVEVTALPDVETLDRMLRIPKMDKLTIHLKRPNPDDFHNIEKKVLEKLDSQNLHKQEIVLFAKAGETIKPDEDTLAQARVAASNGHVSVVGRDASGMKVEESTDKRPFQMLARVNSAVETCMDVLVRVIHAIPPNTRNN